MKIGAVAKATGIPAKTIRFYESVGLLEAPARSDGNYRVYGERDVATLRFVQRARGLGFSIKEAESLVALWHDRQRASADVQALASAHLEAIERKLRELQGMRDTLHHLIERCHGDSRPDCPIIDELATGHGEA
ncbi:MAG: Cu(I)-responsive transcriptional regulator [Alphaproteobacteria bacterium]|nr:Cu(I)-responsive transcriptional regulator [Alphaproteobacteria bacterium]